MPILPRSVVLGVKPPVAKDADDSAPLPPYVSVSEILGTAASAIERALPDTVWVKGEVLDYRDRSGHHYFKLVEHRDGGRDAVLPAAIWTRHWAAIEAKLSAAGMELTNGQEMLFRGRVSLYDGGGSLTLNVTGVLPEFTLGQVEMKRRAVLERLTREGLCRVNKQFSFPDIPLRIGLVSSLDAAGYHDFVRILGRSGYHFHVFFLNVPVQGPEMERAVCNALSVLSDRHRRLQLDVLCIVRGGGGAIDLGWWNSYLIGAAVANMPLPVITGIGHDQDHVAVDDVAHTRAATPTAAAELIVRIVQKADADLRRLRKDVAILAACRLAEQTKELLTNRISAGDLARAAWSRGTDQYRHLAQEIPVQARLILRHQRQQVGKASADIQDDVPRGIAFAREEVEGFKDHLAKAAQVQLAFRRREQDGMEAQLTGEVRGALARQKKELTQLQQLVDAHDPAVILRRGYSITVDAAGKSVKDATRLAPGEPILTLLSHGRLQSTVTGTSTNPEGGISWQT